MPTERGAAGLELSAGVRARGVEVQLTVAPGETVAILGPNGAGKSSLLGMVAGLIRPDTGFVSLDGRILSDARAPRRTWTPASARRIALLGQQPMLFPHLTALENVAFGPRAAGVSRRPARERAARWLGELDADAFADRKPAQLSGGQAQRVAIARALAAEPALLLLDEPMAALDVTVAATLRQALDRLLAGRTTVIVTHDVTDAYALADSVCVMDAGRMLETGPTAQVLRRPRTAFTAALVGLNLLHGRRDGERVSLGRSTQGPALRLAAPASTTTTHSATHVGVLVPPGSVSVRPVDGSEESGGVRATVAHVAPRGETVRVTLALGPDADDQTLAADVPAGWAAVSGLVAGMSVVAYPRPDALDIFDF